MLRNKLKHDSTLLYYQLYRFLQKNGFPPSFHPINIKLKKINHTVSDFKAILPLKKKFGLFLEGDWDSPSPLDEWDKYRAIREHFEKGTVWENTDFYQRVSKELREGRIKWGCRNECDLKARLTWLSQLFKDIEKRGILPHREVNGSKPWGDICLCVNRNGQLLFGDGGHRFSIAKILELDSIPARIAVIHKDLRTKHLNAKLCIDAQLANHYLDR